jgi:hypothetical protein
LIICAQASTDGMQLESETPGAPSFFWDEQLRRGWRILEIRSEASGLEQLYLNITDQRDSPSQEKTI